MFRFPPLGHQWLHVYLVKYGNWHFNFQPAGDELSV